MRNVQDYYCWHERVIQASTMMLRHGCRALLHISCVQNRIANYHLSGVQASLTCQALVAPQE